MKYVTEILIRNANGDILNSLNIAEYDLSKPFARADMIEELMSMIRLADDPRKRNAQPIES